MKIYLILCLASVALALPRTDPINCIDGCTCKDIIVNILNVVGCDRALTINSTIFSHLDRRSLTVVRFSNVIIDQIQEDAFKQMPNLEDVIIEKAQIGSIDQKAFNNVKKVKFADCGFEDSPVLSSEKIEELHYGNCKLDVIPNLDNLAKLTFLNLSGNYIRDIDVVAFALLFDLNSLILSNNEISKITENIFVNNQDLNSLYLDNNPLKAFYLNNSNKLETLSLKNCFLSTFDERSSQRLFSLSELNLANNRIRSIKANDLASMAQLTVIDLSGNSFKKLDNDIFSNNPKLQKVTLDNNKLEALPNFTLSNNENFQIYTFSCKNCGLQTIHPKAFKSMPAIYNLNLAYNNLRSLQNVLTYIKSLRMLDISYNNIISLTSSFDNNRNLESINLSGNALMELYPEDFANNKAIKKIDASNCSLHKLWNNNGTVLNSVRQLFIADNHLEVLSIADFRILPKLDIIDLSNNPLVFNDQLCKVIHFLEQQFVSPIRNSKSGSEGALSDDIDNFTLNQWSELHNNKCPEMSNGIYDSENTEYVYFDDKHYSSGIKIDESKDDDDDDYDENESYDEGYDDYNDKIELENDGDDVDVKNTAEVIDGENINLARVSYILSITSVFVLTALAVLIMAVVITLCILRRNNTFNMHRANLPRIKILPLWNSQLTEKKHSGSIYRPLSEDLSGPKTPKMSRYDFAASPTVHASQ